MRTDILPEDTARLLDACSTDPRFGRLLLIGGTALALHAGHRVSEDLDFVTADQKLDRRLIDGILETLGAKGFTLKKIEYDDARQDMEDAGEDLDDHQQDWNVGGTKLTFVSARQGAETRLVAAADAVPCGHVRVAGPDLIFRLKALTVCDRTRSRDIFDVWWFLEHGGKAVADLESAVSELKPHHPFDSVKTRLLHAKPPPTDPGFQAVMPSPPDLEGVRAAISRHVDDYEVAKSEARTLDGRRAFHFIVTNGAAGLRRLPGHLAAKKGGEAKWYASTLEDDTPGKFAVEAAVAEFLAPTAGGTAPRPGRTPKP